VKDCALTVIQLKPMKVNPEGLTTTSDRMKEEINIKNCFLSKTLKASTIVRMIVLGFFISLMVFGMMMIIGIIPEFPEAENTIGLLIFISIIPLAIMMKMVSRRKKSKKRRAFTQDTKDLVLQRQNHRCNVCGVSPSNWDFDHIGSRANNSPSNCQALCLDCHRDKTTRETRQSKRR
jgi:hypothetical protein